jgi:hypothetical protein
LIVRFLAMFEDGGNYASPMNNFLNVFAAEMNKVPAEKLERLGATFLMTIKVVETAIGDRAFRLVRALNAAVFESVMVGIAKRLECGDAVDSTKVSVAYENLLQNGAYRQAVERSTANEDNVRTRLALATEAFAEV